MEYTYDDLLEITENYLNQIDLSSYVSGDRVNVMELAPLLQDKIDNGEFPPLPEPLKGSLLSAFDEWDLTCYLRKKYNKAWEEEVKYTYYLLPKKEAE